MKQPLTKTEIYGKIEEICRDSTILKPRNLKIPWRTNLLLYCLETLDYEYGIHVDINTTEGAYIPVRRYNCEPTFVPTSTRAKDVRIVDLETYAINEDDLEEGYVYILIVEEVI